MSDGRSSLGRELIREARRKVIVIASMKDMTRYEVGSTSVVVIATIIFIVLRQLWTMIWTWSR
jgi:hypothetical protein